MPPTTRGQLEVQAPLDRLRYLRELQLEADRRARVLYRADFPTPGALAAAVEPGTVQTPALDVVDDALADVEGGDCDRLMVWMPPQEGKSTRVTVMTPLWMLARDPNRRIGIATHSQDLANDFGSAIRNYITGNSGEDDTLDLGLRIAPDNGAAHRWRLDGYRGGVRAVGIAGSLTGRPLDALVIDDPVANMEQAQSVAYQQRALNFWQAVGSTRLAPGAPVIVVLTRWHENDLAGKLLAAEDGHRWRVVSIPAIAESPSDPLGREPGEAMMSARGERDWKAIRIEKGEYVWAALYQQRPAPAEGGLFKRAKVKHWTWVDEPSLGRKALRIEGREVYLETLWKFLTVDLAISKRTSADYTAVGVWGVTMDGSLVLLDGLRARLGEDEHFPNVGGLRDKWDAGTVFVEASQHGTTLVYEAGRTGTPIGKLTADKDKFTRALPASTRVNAGRLFVPSLVEAPWMSEWLDEWAAFPNAAHDDTVDILAYAATVAAEHWLPPVTAEQADQFRTISPTDGLDFMAAQF